MRRWSWLLRTATTCSRSTTRSSLKWLGSVAQPEPTFPSDPTCTKCSTSFPKTLSWSYTHAGLPLTPSALLTQSRRSGSISTTFWVWLTVSTRWRTTCSSRTSRSWKRDDHSATSSSWTTTFRVSSCSCRMESPSTTTPVTKVMRCWYPWRRIWSSSETWLTWGRR